MSHKKEIKGAVDVVYYFCSEPNELGNACRLASFTFRNDFVIFEDVEYGHSRHLNYDQFREMIKAYQLAQKVESGGI